MEEYESNANFTSLISNLTSEDRLLARVFIIHARFVLLHVLMQYLFIYLFIFRVEDTDELLSVIVRLQHLENFVWIINERALTSNSSVLFDGLLGVRLHNSFNEENLLVDATNLLVETFSKFINHSLFWSEKTSAINCSSTEPWSYGTDLYRYINSFYFYIKKIVFFFCRELLHTSIVNGKTGNIEFNEEGDRVESLYEIINIQQGQLKVVGTYRTNTVSFRVEESIEKQRNIMNESMKL
jgi:hypothetical protein